MESRAAGLPSLALQTFAYVGAVLQLLQVGAVAWSACVGGVDVEPWICHGEHSSFPW